jgi:cytochrome b561
MAGRAGHGILCLLLIAVPLTGWYAAGRLGRFIAVKGVALPGPAKAVQGPPGPVPDLHQVVGNLIPIIAGLHAAMAHWHHFVKRDATQRQMNPS